MVAEQPRRAEIDEPLNGTDGAERAPDVLEQQKAPTGPQDALGFPDREAIVRNRAQRETEHDGVEALGREAQSLRIANVQVDVSPGLGGPSPCVREHPRAEIDAGHVRETAMQGS